MTSCSCRLGLQFFPDRPLALKEMVRVLKPGGRVGLSVYSAIEQTPAAHAFVQSLDKYLGSAMIRTKRSEHLSWTAWEVGAWASRGFRRCRCGHRYRTNHFPIDAGLRPFSAYSDTDGCSLKRKDAAQGDRVIRSISADAASRLDPSMMDGRLTFPQESSVIKASKG